MSRASQLVKSLIGVPSSKKSTVGESKAGKDKKNQLIDEINETITEINKIAPEVITRPKVDKEDLMESHVDSLRAIKSENENILNSLKEKKRLIDDIINMTKKINEGKPESEQLRMTKGDIQTYYRADINWVKEMHSKTDAEYRSLSTLASKISVPTQSLEAKIKRGEVKLKDIGPETITTLKEIESKELKPKVKSENGDVKAKKTDTKWFWYIILILAIAIVAFSIFWVIGSIIAILISVPAYNAGRINKNELFWNFILGPVYLFMRIGGWAE